MSFHNRKPFIYATDMDNVVAKIRASGLEGSALYVMTNDYNAAEYLQPLRQS